MNTKKLTINIDEDVYQDLHSKIGRGKIGKFISITLRPLISEKELEKGYQAMAADEKSQKQAHIDSEDLLTNFDNENDENYQTW